jgi:hypothetical protein
MDVATWLEARADEMAALLCDLAAVDTTRPRDVIQLVSTRRPGAPPAPAISATPA